MATNRKIHRPAPQLGRAGENRSVSRFDQDRARAMGLTPQEVGAKSAWDIAVGPSPSRNTVRASSISTWSPAAVADERLDLDRLPTINNCKSRKRRSAVPLSQFARLNYEYEEPILWAAQSDRHTVLTVARRRHRQTLQAPDCHQGGAGQNSKPIKDRASLWLKRIRNRRVVSRRASRGTVRWWPFPGDGDRDAVALS